MFVMTALASTTRTGDLAVRLGGEEWVEVETGRVPPEDGRDRCYGSDDRFS